MATEEHPEEELSKRQIVRSKWFPKQGENGNDYRPETPEGWWTKLRGVPLKSSTWAAQPVVLCVLVFILCFIAFALMGVTDKYIFQNRTVQLLLGPTGATAAGVFGAPRATSNQLRSILFGHAIAPAIAVSLQKLFFHGQNSSMNSNKEWILTAVTVGSVTALMALFDCVHPPGVAIAATYVTSPNLQGLGYRYVASSMLGLLAIWFVALVIGNWSRLYSYPAYWI